MEDVKLGDIIFSCVNRKIVSVNIAKGDGFSHTRPKEIEKFGLWNEEGWIILVDYHKLKNPIKIDDFLDDIMKKQGQKYAPINKNGRGNQGYLYPINDNLGDYLIDIICRKGNDVDSLNENIKEIYICNLPDDEVKNKAQKAKGKPKSKESKVIQYDRDQYVVEYTRRRANGICELCGNEAPFKNSKGEPYLEVHHIVWLSRGGDDTIENTAALCPNCHRKMHIINSQEDIEHLKSNR
ncbi:HNH endonuclease [Paeniclostridium sp. NSJ-45]|uniref:HNH endonuclease n=2 Tax=Paeniclostridium hominis TaxID=2764329 RepID=A0ABR7K276_9FIRM|nr:HNH endonuclease [Paeniclostridium hominis]